jgi:hypothetical protein
MLSAEHLALQSRLVQQLAAIKQKELDYVLSRYQAIGVQSALIAACAMQTFVSLDPANVTVARGATWLFFISSVCCTLGCTHVTVLCLYIGNWAPGLALRGPTGSLNRAFDAVMQERAQVNFWFSISLATFVIQTTLAVWILDDTPGVTGWAVVCTLIAFVWSYYCVRYLVRMRQRFFRDEIYDEASRSIKDSGGGHKPTLPGLPRLPASVSSGVQSLARRVHRAPAQTAGAPASPGRTGDGRERRVTLEVERTDVSKAPLLADKCSSSSSAAIVPAASVAAGSSPMGLRSAMAGARASTTTGVEVRGKSTAGGAGGAGAKERRGSLTSMAGALMTSQTVAWAAKKLQARVRGNSARGRVSSRRLTGEWPSSNPGGSPPSSAPAASGGSGGGLSRAPTVAGGGGGRRKEKRSSITGLSDNPLALVLGNKDVALGASQTPFSKHSRAQQQLEDERSSGGSRKSSEFEMSGWLEKRAGLDNQPKGSWLSSLRRGASVASVNLSLTPSWQPRFFVLHETQLSYWHDEPGTEVGPELPKPPSSVIELSGYEVLVDMTDANWGFELRPTLSNARARTWYFRAKTEEERLEWTKRLVVASYVGSTRSSRKHRSTSFFS